MSGRWTMPSRIGLPQNRPRASTMAMMMQSGRLPAMAQAATRRLRRTAVISSGLSANIGRSLGGGEAPALEDRPRSGRLQVVDVGRRLRAPRVRDDGHRIDDRRMDILRARADDPDARLGGGVGPVDDAERRSEELRVGHECCIPCRFRWSPGPYKT